MSPKDVSAHLFLHTFDAVLHVVLCEIYEHDQQVCCAFLSVWVVEALKPKPYLGVMTLSS